MRYLKGTKHSQLHLGGRLNGNETITALSDADWVGDVADKRSTSSAVVLCCGSPFSWFTRKQTLRVHH